MTVQEENQTPVATNSLNMSLVTAVHLLLQRTGADYPVEDISGFYAIQPGLNDSSIPTAPAIWKSVPSFDSMLYLAETGNYGTWPTGNDSIVRFQYQDRQTPYIEVNGERQANLVDHYCLVADAGDHQIIDSADGVIKNGNIYGNPVGWASYGFLEQPVVPAAGPPKPGTWYTVLNGGESAYAIARKLKMPAEDLIEHNIDEFEDPSNIPGGTVLHLPYALPEKPKTPQIEYELFDEPYEMHVVIEGGARKFAFANAQKWEDLQQTGPTYPLNTNVEIVAIAHVPIGDDKAAYYMEASSLGNYKTTGKVLYTIGFSHAHLADGHVEKVKVEMQPKMVEQVQQVEKSIEQQKATFAPKPTIINDVIAQPKPEPTPEPKPNLDLWKTTYVPFADGPRVYLADVDMMVHDLDGRRPTRQLHKYGGVNIAGTFEKDGVTYGRPNRTTDNWHWYGVPMDRMIMEDEIFRAPTTLPERLAVRTPQLSFVERYVTVPLSKVLSQSVRLRGYAEKIKQKV